MRLTVFVAVAATLVGAFVYMAPAADVDRAHLDDRASIANDAAIKPSREEDLPQGTIDSGGIESDLDGNASALVASDWTGPLSPHSPYLDL